MIIDKEIAMKPGTWSILILVVLSFGGPSARSDEPQSQPKAENPKPQRFKIPLRVNEDATLIERIDLFVSRDEGKSWRRTETVQPTASYSFVEFAEVGVYWFTTQVVWRDGTKAPESEREFRPALVVTFDGEKVTTTLPRVITEAEYNEMLRKDRENLTRLVESLQKRVEVLERRLSVLEGKPPER
jgi:hypothetical protein